MKNKFEGFTWEKNSATRSSLIIMGACIDETIEELLHEKPKKPDSMGIAELVFATSAYGLSKLRANIIDTLKVIDERTKISENKDA